MNVKQISVELRHIPGTLYEMTTALADNGISMRALTVANSTDTSTVRIIVDNVIWASSVLMDAGFLPAFSDVIAVEVPNKPGGLNHVLAILKDGNVNIEYMYHVGEKYSAFGGSICIIFKFTDNEHAAEVLSSSGVKMLEHKDLALM